MSIEITHPVLRQIPITRQMITRQMIARQMIARHMIAWLHISMY